jgi:hypothetical protein
MGYYAAFKRNEILTDDNMWIRLEDIMLSEIARHKGQTLYDSIYVKFIETKQWWPGDKEE